MQKITKKMQAEFIVGEMQYWLDMIRALVKRGDLEEAEKYRFAMDGSKIVIRHLGMDSLVEKMEAICQQAWTVTEEARRQRGAA